MYSYTITIDGHTFTNGDISTPKLRKAVSAKGFPIGEVVMGVFTVGVPPGIPPNGLQFRERAEVKFGVTTEFEQLSLGTYFIAKRNRAHNFGVIGERMALTCYDRMAYANQDFDYPGDENTEVSFIEALQYGAAKIGATVEVPFGLGGYYLKLDRDRKIRDVFGLVAGATGTNCMMSSCDVLTFVEPFHDGGNYYGIPNEDRTEPYLGREWKPLRVTFYNDKERFSAGDGDFLHEIKLYNDAACQEMADYVYNKLKGHVYLPFKVKRAKVPVWIELFDNTNVWEYVDNTVAPPVTSYSFIANLSMDYLPDCAYATFSADDIDEVRDEFAWFTDQDKVKKDEKNSTVKIGNRYGMKSVGINKGKDSVGAEAATTVTEARFDNAEITFKDKTDEENPVDGGKLFYDIEKQSANMLMKDLPTQAQDLHGAIEELFAQGTSGGWVRPKEWIELPEPGENQATMHVIVTEDNLNIERGQIGARSCTEYDGPAGNYIPPSGHVEIDWGDGTKDTGNEGNINFILDHTYAQPGQYIITVTSTISAESGICLTGVYAAGAWGITGIKVGAGLKWNKSTTHIAGIATLKEVYAYGSEKDFSTSNSTPFGGVRGLEILQLPETAEIIGDSFMSYANTPVRLYLPNVKTMGAWCFSCNTEIIEIDCPKLETVDIQFAWGSSGLRKINFPSLKSAGAGFCEGCYNLTTVNIPETAILGDGAFNECYSLLR